MGLGKHLHFDGQSWQCQICDRGFISRGALLAHCKYTNKHEWCGRCRRAFPTEAAYEAHVRNSPSHNFCTSCPSKRDFASPIYLKHHRETKHHWCSDCDEEFDDEPDLEEHGEEVHYRCKDCKRVFENENELRMHKQTHAPRCLTCFACRAVDFKSFSGMLIHLESGACQSKIKRRQVNSTALLHPRSAEYSNASSSEFLYRCPSCDRVYNRLSGLHQHAEDALSCSHLLGRFQILDLLQDFLEAKLR